MNQTLIALSQQNSCNGAFKRELWTEREDEILREIYPEVSEEEKKTEIDWNSLAEIMTKEYNCKLRVGKQLRERWVNHLDPSVSKGYWEKAEEDILFEKQLAIGNKWSEIAKFLPGRTDNSVKNYFYSKLRRQVRYLVKILSKNEVFIKEEIDEKVYEANYVYKLIKDLKLPYQEVNKTKIIEVIHQHMKGGYQPVRKNKKRKNSNNISVDSIDADESRNISKQHTNINNNNSNRENNNKYFQNKKSNTEDRINTNITINKQRNNTNDSSNNISNNRAINNQVSKTKFATVKKAETIQSSNLKHQDNNKFESQYTKRKRLKSIDINNEIIANINREKRARRFHDTDIKIVILKKVFESEDNNYDDYDYDYTQVKRKKVEDIYGEEENNNADEDESNRVARSHNYSFYSFKNKSNNNNIINQPGRSNTTVARNSRTSNAFEGNISLSEERELGSSKNSPSKLAMKKRKQLKPLMIDTEYSVSEKEINATDKEFEANNKQSNASSRTNIVNNSNKSNNRSGQDTHKNIILNSFNTYQPETPGNAGFFRSNNEIVTPRNKHNSFAPIVSPLNDSLGNIIASGRNANTNSLNMSLENFFKPLDYNKYDASKMMSKNASQGRENQQLVKPTARNMLNLSLDVDEINKTDTNSFFNNYRKLTPVNNTSNNSNSNIVGSNSSVWYFD